MKYSRFLSTLGTLLILPFFCLGGSAQESATWEQLEKALQEGKTKTVIKLADELKRSEAEEKDWGQSGRAIVIKVTAKIKLDDGVEKALPWIDKEIASSPVELKPVLYAMRGMWLGNRLDRSSSPWSPANASSDEVELADPENLDITTWSSQRLYFEIIRSFAKALEDPRQLQNQRIEDFKGLIEAGQIDDVARPTLYDFVVREVIVKTASLAEIRDDFLPRIDPCLSARERFLEADFPASGLRVDADFSDKLGWQEPVQLWQNLLTFHQQREAGGEALLHADLDRLEWMFSAVIDKPEAILKAYQAQLEKLIEEAGGRPVAARARLLLARHHLASRADGQVRFRDPSLGYDAWKNPKLAKQIASVGAQEHPDSPFGKQCLDLVERIESKEIRFQLRNQWLPGQEVLSVRTRNLKKLYCRVYPQTWQPIKWLRDHGNRSLEHGAIDDLLLKQPSHSWEVEIADSGEHHFIVTNVTAPKGIRMGANILIISDDKNFDKNRSLIAAGGFFRSDLGLYLRAKDRESICGYVLSSKTGDPVGKQMVEARWRAGKIIKNRRRRANSDPDGYFSLEVAGRTQIAAVSGDGGVSVVQESFYGDSGSVRRGQYSLFFTDRRAYRPGQTIQFKAIITDRKNEKSPRSLVKGEKYDVQLKGANGDLVSTLQLTTNSFGSLSGEFEVPMSGLLGSHWIVIPKIQGGARIRVEEYKRPVFEAEIETRDEPGAINDDVELRVTAKAFSGEGMDGAKVEWRVMRSARWSPRCMVLSHFNNAKQVSQGMGMTGKGGVYDFSFKALPDPLVETTFEAKYSYSVVADLTAPSGESITKTWSITLGAADFSSELVLPSGILKSNEPIELRISTDSHGGKAVAREGELIVKKVERNPSDMERFGFAKPAPRVNQPKFETIQTLEISTDRQGKADTTLKLAAGEYEIEFIGRDSKGRKSTKLVRLKVFDVEAGKCAIAKSFMVETEARSLNVGEEFQLLWASGHETARARIEIFRDGEMIHAQWTKPELTQQLIRYPVAEELRGGFAVNVFQMHHGQLFERSIDVWVEHSNKDLKLEWKHLSSKLEPGAKDVWTLAIRDYMGDPAQAAEMVGTLYDASLDALFGRHSFPIPSLWRDSDRTGFLSSESTGGTDSMVPLYSWDRPNEHYDGSPLFASFERTFPRRRSFKFRRGLGGAGAAGGFGEGRSAGDGFGAALMSATSVADAASPAQGQRGDPFGGAADEAEEKGNGPKPPIRTNLEETAFFLPHLISKEDGTVEISFTIPEAATKWNFKGFAHDQQMRYGELSGETITTRDFMVRPNPPRFVRVGDEIEFTARLVNQGRSTARGDAVIQLRRSSDDKEITKSFGLTDFKVPFEIPAGESKTVKWRLKVPEMTDWVIYRASAMARFDATDDTPAKSFGDGEESWLPVLPRRILVRDAQTLTLRQPGEATLELDSLINAKSTSEGGPINVGYTVEAVPRPAWLAVKALPYLMEYPHECSEQVFNRYFANSLASHLVKKNPEIKQVFKAWKAEALGAKGDDAFNSPLARNEQLKGVMLEETPFLLDAVGEREERLRIAKLFDADKTERELDRAFKKLTDQQMQNGAWPWFPGSRARPNFYITAYVTAGFGRLRKIGVDIASVDPALKALPYLDREMRDRYDRIAKADALAGNYLDQSVVLYLYAHSFFKSDFRVSPYYRTSFEFWEKQALDNWNSLGSLQSQAQLAVALKRCDQDGTAKLIMDSLRENSLLHDDLGRHWRQLDRGGYRWWDAPIESQTAIIEAFLEAEGDKQGVIDCQTWLLQQKRTQHWESTKATADAIYAVLIDGKVDLLSRGEPMTIAVGSRSKIGVDGKAEVEAGTGRITFQLSGDAIKPSDGRVTVVKESEGPSWVSVYWQSLQDISKIEARDTNGEGEGRDAALAIEKTVFVERQTDDGKKLQPYRGAGSLRVGESLVTRLIIRNDRIYEFIHIKDQRAAGAEPLDAISGYRWNADMSYYQETRDAATHFFVDRLPAGSHVLEYRVKIQHAGDFGTGIAEIECLYAPEFRARSGSLQLNVAPLK